MFIPCFDELNIVHNKNDVGHNMSVFTTYSIVHYYIEPHGTPVNVSHFKLVCILNTSFADVCVCAWVVITPWEWATAGKYRVNSEPVDQWNDHNEL